MNLLLEKGGKDWKYFINTVGTALPGRPAMEIVDNMLANLDGDVIGKKSVTHLKYFRTLKQLERAMWQNIKIDMTYLHRY